jgi:hypothetical protein
MGGAEAAVERTALFNGPVAEVRMNGIFRPPPFGHGGLAAPYDCPEGTVVPALFDQKDLVPFSHPFRLDPLEAHGAEAFGFIHVTLFHLAIHSCMPF